MLFALTVTYLAKIFAWPTFIPLASLGVICVLTIILIVFFSYKICNIQKYKDKYDILLPLAYY